MSGPARPEASQLSLRERARAALPPDVFHYYATGSGQGWTAAAEEAGAWADVWLRPRVLHDVSHVTTSTTMLGVGVQGPVALAPSAAHQLAHAEGEVATAAAAREASALLVLSMRSSRRVEDVAAAAGPWWQQIYVLRDRGVSDEVARRAAAAGATALVLTVDAPYVACKPGLVRVPTLGEGIVEDLDDRDESDERLQQAPDLAAADVTRLREVSGLPVVVKGVLRGDEAVRCLDAGASGVVVSTHGGRQLDGVVPVPWALPEVSESVGDRAEVYADGGIRTGRDVLRALALGARAVLVGRPVLWGLATGGRQGVREVLDALASELREALALAGCAAVADVGPDLVVDPRRR